MFEMTVDDMPPAAVTVESTDVGKRVTVRLSREQLAELHDGREVYVDNVDDPAKGGGGDPPLDVVSVTITAGRAS